jgi:hypothetical protein
MSPASKVDEGLELSLSRSAGNIKCRPMERKGSIGVASRAYAAKSRFQQPSAATSLPALALIDVEVQPQSMKDGKKIAELKRSVPALMLACKNSTNIAKMKRDVKGIKEDNNKKLLKSIKNTSVPNKTISGYGKNEIQEKSQEVFDDKGVPKVTSDSEDNGGKRQVVGSFEEKENVESAVGKYNAEEMQEEKIIR